MLEVLVVSVLVSGAALLAHVHQKPRVTVGAVPAVESRPIEHSGFADTTFLVKAARIAMYGLLLGALAIEKSRDPAVRAFGEKLLQESQVVSTVITSIARLRGMSSAAALDPHQRSIMQQLSQLSGADFDSGFLAAALSGYQSALTVFELETRAGRDDKLKEFASDMLPRLNRRIRAISVLAGSDFLRN